MTHPNQSLVVSVVLCKTTFHSTHTFGFSERDLELTEVSEKQQSTDTDSKML